LSRGGSRALEAAFSLYQWDLEEGSKASELSSLMNLEEKTFQLRDNLVLPPDT